MHFLSIPKALALAVAFVLSGIALASHSQEKIVRPKDGQSAVSKDGLAKLLEASRAIAAKDPKSAELAFREAAKLLPNSIEPLLGLAEVARMRNDSKSIEKWLKEALRVAPGNAEAQVAWGRYLFATKKFAEAETALKKARALDAALLAPSLDLG